MNEWIVSIIFAYYLKYALHFNWRSHAAEIYFPVMAEAGQSEENVYLSDWLYKYTNALKGFKKRWFRLQNPLLSYYKYVIYTHLTIHSEIRNQSVLNAKDQ